VFGSPISELDDPNPVHRIRGEPVLDHPAQRVFRTIHDFPSMLYHAVNLVERFLNCFRNSRLNFTRHEKPADSHLVIAPLACMFGPRVQM
jgi:hypothetical protein